MPSDAPCFNAWSVLVIVAEELCVSHWPQEIEVTCTLSWLAIALAMSIWPWSLLGAS